MPHDASKSLLAKEGAGNSPARFPALDVLASSAGNLAYDSLSALLWSLALSIRIESAKETAGGRLRNAERLKRCSESVRQSETAIDAAWEICRPHMDYGTGAKHGYDIPESRMSVVELGRRLGSMDGPALSRFLGHLSEKLALDSGADANRGRVRLAWRLATAAAALAEAGAALSGAESQEA